MDLLERAASALAAYQARIKELTLTLATSCNEARDEVDVNGMPFGCTRAFAAEAQVAALTAENEALKRGPAQLKGLLEWLDQFATSDDPNHSYVRNAREVIIASDRTAAALRAALKDASVSAKQGAAYWNSPSTAAAFMATAKICDAALAEAQS